MAEGLPETMRAVLLTGIGGYERLELRDDVPVPRPDTGDVLIRVGAAGVNNTDINTRIGWYSRSVAAATDASGGAGLVGAGDTGWSGSTLVFPRIQGADCCGRIVAVGAGGSETRIGERVLIDPLIRTSDGRVRYLGSDIDGAFAEYGCQRAPALEGRAPVREHRGDVRLVQLSPAGLEEDGYHTPDHPPEEGVGPDVDRHEPAGPPHPDRMDGPDWLSIRPPEGAEVVTADEGRPGARHRGGIERDPHPERVALAERAARSVPDGVAVLPVPRRAAGVEPGRGTPEIMDPDVPREQGSKCPLQLRPREPPRPAEGNHLVAGVNPGVGPAGRYWEALTNYEAALRAWEARQLPPGEDPQDEL